jgi:hypothetical protein
LPETSSRPILKERGGRGAVLCVKARFRKRGALDGLSRIVLITGLMAAGKSTIGQILAERLPKSVHLRGDIFRKMIVNGKADMTPTPSEEALAQLDLRYSLACATAEGYAAAGFRVLYQDVVLGSFLSKIAQRLARWRPGIVVLAPSLDAIEAREQGRTKSAYGQSWSPTMLGQALEQTPRLGLWLDSTGLTPEQTVDQILARRHEMRTGL